MAEIEKIIIGDSYDGFAIDIYYEGYDDNASEEENDAHIKHFWFSQEESPAKKMKKLLKTLGYDNVAINELY